MEIRGLIRYPPFVLGNSDGHALLSFVLIVGGRRKMNVRTVIRRDDLSRLRSRDVVVVEGEWADRYFAADRVRRLDRWRESVAS